MKTGRTPAWLFLSYDLDKGNITAVRRVAKASQQWADWNVFVSEQVDRCLTNSLEIPNERVYAFSFNDLDSIPFLQGDNNNHYIDFVSKSVPVYQLGILECAFAMEKNIPPTELRLSPENYDAYTEYVSGIQQKLDMEVFRQTVRTDSGNYELLYELVARYTDIPDITEQQVEILNASPAGLRIFSVLEEILSSSEYVIGLLDLDSYDSLVHTPVDRRTGIHYLKAELEKFDYSTGRKGQQDDLEKDKKILELTLFIRRFEIKRDWEAYGPDREWFSACIARMSDAETIACEIRNFSYLPALTRAQIQYLMRTGTSAETLFRSGIMGDVIMETPFFRQSFGLDLTQIGERKLDALDGLVIESQRIVVESSLKWLIEVKDNPEETDEVRDMAAAKIPKVEGYLQQIDGFINESRKVSHMDSEQDVLNVFREALEKASGYFALHPYESVEGTVLPVENEVVHVLSANPADTALSEKMADALLGYVDRLPNGLLARCKSAFCSHVYGQLPVNHDLTVGHLLCKDNLETSLQKLAVAVECSRMSNQMDRMAEDLAEKRRTERRIQKEINDLYDRIEDCKSRIASLREKLKGSCEGSKTE